MAVSHVHLDSQSPAAVGNARGSRSVWRGIGNHRGLVARVRQRAGTSALETNALIANSQQARCSLSYESSQIAPSAVRKHPSTRALLLAGEIREDGSALESCVRGFLRSVRGGYQREIAIAVSAAHLGAREKLLSFAGIFRCSRQLALQGMSGACLGPAYLQSPTGSCQSRLPPRFTAATVNGSAAW